jgi:hypothetical protein
MNPPPSLTVSPETSREVPAQDVLGDTGVSPNVSQPVTVQDDDSGVPVSLETVLRKQIEEFRTRSLAENTVPGYESDWRDFEAWCGKQNRPALPADAETLCSIWSTVPRG